MFTNLLHNYPERLVNDELFELVWHNHASVHHNNSLVFHLGSWLVNLQLDVLEHFLNKVVIKPLIFDLELQLFKMMLQIQFYHRHHELVLVSNIFQLSLIALLDDILDFELLWGFYYKKQVFGVLAFYGDGETVTIVIGNVLDLFTVLFGLGVKCMDIEVVVKF